MPTKAGWMDGNRPHRPPPETISSRTPGHFPTHERNFRNALDEACRVPSAECPASGRGPATRNVSVSGAPEAARVRRGAEAAGSSASFALNGGWNNTTNTLPGVRPVEVGLRQAVGTRGAGMWRAQLPGLPLAGRSTVLLGAPSPPRRIGHGLGPARTRPGPPVPSRWGGSGWRTHRSPRRGAWREGECCPRLLRWLLRHGRNP
jgi:hypothetical protein